MRKLMLGLAASIALVFSAFRPAAPSATYATVYIYRGGQLFSALTN